MVQIWWSLLKRVMTYRADKLVIDARMDTHTDRCRQRQYPKAKTGLEEKCFVKYLISETNLTNCLFIETKKKIKLFHLILTWIFFHQHKHFLSTKCISNYMSGRHADNWSHPSHYLVDPYTWPWSPNVHGHEWPTCHPLCKMSIGPPILRYSFLKIWPRQSMVKVMCVVKGHGHVWPTKFKGQGYVGNNLQVRANNRAKNERNPKSCSKVNAWTRICGRRRRTNRYKNIKSPPVYRGDLNITWNYTPAILFSPQRVWLMMA